MSARGLNSSVIAAGVTPGPSAVGRVAMASIFTSMRLLERFTLTNSAAAIEKKEPILLRPLRWAGLCFGRLIAWLVRKAGI
jgi:hypothetical protein